MITVRNPQRRAEELRNTMKLIGQSLGATGAKIGTSSVDGPWPPALVGFRPSKEVLGNVVFTCRVFQELQKTDDREAIAFAMSSLWTTCMNHLTDLIVHNEGHRPWWKRLMVGAGLNMSEDNWTAFVLLALYLHCDGNFQQMIDVCQVLDAKSEREGRRRL